MSFMGILAKMADPRELAILKVFAKKPDAEYTMSEVQRKTKLPVATTYRALKALVGRDFLKEKAVKHLTVYSLALNDSAQTIISLLYEHPEPLRLFLEKVEALPSVVEIAMNAKTENSASLIIIGSDVPKGPINEDVGMILDRYSYKVTYIVLEFEQYEQMVSMGLYPTKPQILYRKLPS